MEKIVFGSVLRATFQYQSSYKFKETGNFSVEDQTYPQITDQWQFVSSAAVIDASNSTAKHQLQVGIRISDNFDTSFISNPFVIFVDSSLKIPDAEIIRWAKEYRGGTYGVPANSYAIRNDVPLYITDSTRFLKGRLQRNVAGSWTEIGGVRTASITSDNNYTSTSDNVIFLEVQISANRTLTLPAPSAALKGTEIKIWNRNKTVSSWQLSGNVVNASGAPITTLTNSTWYNLICDGSVWSRTN